MNGSGRIWRIRVKYGGLEDLTAEAWGRGEVGVWYGQWTADDWRKASAAGPQRLASELNRLHREKGATFAVKKSWVDTVGRFCGIGEEDYVLTFFEDQFHLGRLHGPMLSGEPHPLSREQEPFKYRKVVPSGVPFCLKKLPASYQLLAPAGRGNVHRLWDTNGFLAEMLVENRSEAEVVERFREMSENELLDRLGPSGWESLSLGYLIITQAFRPTGLGVGRTLKDYDIVGVNAQTGRRIFAQCKKSPHRLRVDDELRDLLTGATDDNYFLFAYNGVQDGSQVPPNVQIVDKEVVREWLATPMGRDYWRLWGLSAGP